VSGAAQALPQRQRFRGVRTKNDSWSLVMVVGYLTREAFPI